MADRGHRPSVRPVLAVVVRACDVEHRGLIDVDSVEILDGMTTGYRFRHPTPI